MNTLPHGEVFVPTDTVGGQFNTFDPDTGLLVTLAGTPSIRIERLRSGTWSEITGAGITLTVDADHSTAGARTGRHTVSIDLDDANIGALSGDRYDILIHAGTVSGDSMAHVLLGHFYVQSDGLTTAQKADVNTEADTALTDYDAPTKAELDSGLAALNDLSAAEVNAEVDTAIADADIATETKQDAIDTVVDAIKGKTDQLTFSAAGFADVNVMEVRDSGGLSGAGTAGDPWGP